MASELPDPDLHWDEHGAPHSNRFADIYFDPQRGSEESQHVFLHGNNLPARWAGRDCFVIGETGFGTGLNFLLTWAAWRAHRTASQRLHYVSVEGFPLAPGQLVRAVEAWPALGPLAKQLLEQYPLLTPGYHRLHLADDVTLTLLFGEVGEVLQQLEAVVDAWYLDGFAPSRNKAMWRPEVLSEIGRLSADDATLATFTAAGFVRRGLQQAGFDIHKSAGFAGKRERLVGRFIGARSTRLPLWAQHPELTLNQQSALAVVGAGVAGRWVHQALARRGLSATLYGKDDGASANPAANVMPRLATDRSQAARIFWSSYRYALDRWRSLGGFEPRGCLQLAANADAQRRLKQIASAWKTSSDALQYLSANDSADVAGLTVNSGGLWYPEAGLIDGRALQNSATPIEREAVSAIERGPSGWRIDAGKQRRAFEAVVIAAGASVLPPLAELPVAAYHGQLSALPATKTSERLRCTLVNSQYLTPAIGGKHRVGSTFDRVGLNTEPELANAAADTRNREALALNFPALTELATQPPATGWCGVRLTTPDRLPLAGVLPDYDRFIAHLGYLRGHERPPRDLTPLSDAPLYCLAALGARGFTTAPLLAELTVSQLLGEPWPIERELALLLAPARFWVRDLKRRLR